MSHIKGWVKMKSLYVGSYNTRDLFKLVFTKNTITLEVYIIKIFLVSCQIHLLIIN